MTLGENAATSAVDALESIEALDGAALKLAGAVSNAVPVGVPRDALSGTWLGHALHPLLRMWLSGRSSARRCSTCSAATTPAARASASSRSAS